jgi:hypothetical protein
MAANACPAFEDATRRFQEFLLENGWPTEISEFAACSLRKIVNKEQKAKLDGLRGAPVVHFARLKLTCPR